MPTSAECLRNLDEEVINNLSEAELDEIIAQFLRVRQKIATDRFVKDLDAEMDKAAQEIMENLQQKKAKQKLEAVRNRTKLREILELERVAFAATGRAGDGIRARNVGVAASFEGARNSADFQKNALMDGYIRSFITRLQDEDLLAAFASRDNNFERAIFIEKEMVGRGLSKSPTGDKKARKIAEIMHEVDKAKVATENRAGASIDIRKDWLFPTRHHRGNIIKAREEWLATVRELADWETMRIPPDKIDQVLRDMYDGLSKGRMSSLRSGGESNNVFDFVTQSVDVARQASAHRRIVWKNAEAAMKYNERFGETNAMDAWVSELQRSAANTALMRNWGTNPHKTFQEVLNTLRKRYENNPKAIEDLERAPIGNEFKEITGEVNHVVNINGALFGRWTRSVSAMGLLANAGFMTLLDIPIKAAMLRRFRGGKGFPLFEAAMSSIKGLTDAETRRKAALHGVGFEAIIGEINSKFHAMDQAAGLESRLLRGFFKLNFLTYFNDANQRGLAAILGAEVATLPKNFNKLTPERRRFLESYGIDAKKWLLIHDGIIKGPGDELTATAGEIMNVESSVAFDGLTPRQIVDLKDDTRMAYGALVDDMIKSSTLQSGARERALFRRGLQAGTVGGELLRFIGQFKGPPVSVLTRVIGPSLKSKGAKKYADAVLRGEGDVLGMTYLIASLAVTGMLLDQFFQVAKGREPRSRDDPQLWFDGFVRGGSGGLYADLILLESQRYGQSFVGAVAGPAPSALIESTHNIWAKGIRGESVSKDLTRFFRQMSPDAIWMTAALDYLIWFQIMEMLDPGYLARMERGFKSDRGQEFYFPPSRTIPRGGGNRIAEGVR